MVTVSCFESHHDTFAISIAIPAAQYMPRSPEIVDVFHFPELFLHPCVKTISFHDKSMADLIKYLRGRHFK